MPGVRLIREGGVAESLSLVASRAVAVAAPAAVAPPFIPLTTTTQCPPVAKRRISRQRLLHLLQGASEARLILIKGPAGFGKTTLAVQWGEELRAGGLNTAWLRAEQENCEPAVFLQYMAIALEQCCPGAGRPALQVFEEYVVPPVHAILAALVNALAESGEEIYLLVDDFHLVDTPEIREAVCFLLKHAPRHFRIVLTAREVPALPLGTLRARGELFEIDAGALRFSLEETESLLVSEGCPVTGQSEVAVLQNNTGGWAAALRMACSFLRAGMAPEAGLRSTPGGQHALESYLEEVLARLPREVHEFMFATSILKTLSPAMCDAVAGCSHSELLLESLLQRYQLINPENAGATYSYHPLVGDYLRQQLLRRSPARFRELHLKAAHRCFVDGLTAEAIRHAVDAGERALAAEWTGRCAMQLITEGKIGTVLGWRRWLPKDLLRDLLPLRIALGWSMLMAARRKETLAWIDEIEADLSGLPDADGRFRKECLAIRAAVEGHSDASGQSLAIARRYMEAPLTDAWASNAVGNCMIFGHLMAGAHDQAEQVHWFEFTGQQGLRQTSTQIYRLALRGMSLSQRLRFADARICFEEAAVIAARDRGPGSSLAVLPQVFLAHQCYELNRIDEAAQLLHGRLDAINAISFLDCELRAYVVLSRIAYREGDNIQSHQLLDQAERIAAAEEWPRMQAALLVERLRLFLDEGNPAAAAGCVARLEALAEAGRDSDEPAQRHVRGYLRLANGYIDLQAGRPGLAVERLEKLWQYASATGGCYFAVRVGSLQAAALFAAGQDGAALSRFAAVLALAMPAGVIRTIIDNGPEVGPLIAHARAHFAGDLQHAAMSGYLDQLTTVFEQSWRGASVRPLSDVPVASRLTAREGDVLRLVAKGHSNKEIARLAEVSPETIKTHIKNIFQKLGADNRMQAVACGRRMGLFE